MPPKLLKESTVLPDHGRTLRRFTIEDAKRELKIITELQNDKTAFTKGIKVTKDDIM